MAAWYAGLTVLALALAFRGRGLGRIPGMAIITGYLAFVITLVITVEQGTVRPATAMVPAAAITAAGVLLLTWPRRAVMAGRGGLWQRDSVLPGWSVGLLVIGPVGALLTARWTLTAAASCLAIALGGRAGCPGPDLRHRHPVPVPGRRRGRRDDRHRRRGGPAAPASQIAARIS